MNGFKSVFDDSLKSSPSPEAFIVSSTTIFKELLYTKLINRTAVTQLSNATCVGCG